MSTIRLFRETRRCVSTFSWYDFANLQDAHRNMTANPYSGCTLSLIAPQLRGNILEDVGRTVYARHHPNSHIADPVPGYRCNGTRRSRKQAEFDWMCDKTRVQCKSAQLSPNRINAWRCRFANIKQDLCDELFLVLYTPKQLYFICHDGRTGLSSNGLSTASRGYCLAYAPPTSITCPQLAKSWILQRMQQQSCRIIASLRTSSQLVVDKVHVVSCSQKHRLERSAYQHHPLGGMTPTRRGLIIQDIVQQIDQWHHNILTSTEPLPSRFDWLRGHLRVECKHTRMAWHTHKNCWNCGFLGVKTDHFDVLYLALDSPAGIHVLKFHGSKYLNGTGVCEEFIGRTIRIYGPRNETGWSVALDDIMNKLIQSGSEHIATVKW